VYKKLYRLITYALFNCKLCFNTNAFSLSEAINYSFGGNAKESHSKHVTGTKHIKTPLKELINAIFVR